MQFPIIGKGGKASPSETTYMAVSMDATATDATESHWLVPVSEACTLTAFTVSLQTAPGGAAKWVITIRKQGTTNTAATVTIEGASKTATWTGSVEVAEGETLSISVVPTGAPAESPIGTSVVASTASGNFFVMGGVNGNASTSATNYHNPFLINVALVTGVEEGAVVIPGEFTAKKLYVRQSAASGSGKSYTYSALVGATAALAVKIEGTSATTGSTSGEQAMTAGELLAIRIVPAGTPSLAHSAWCLSVKPTTPGQSFYGFGNPNQPSPTGTVYTYPIGTAASYNATEAERPGYFPAAKIGPMYVKLATAPGAGKSRTLTIKDAGSATPVSVKIEGEATAGNTPETATLAGDFNVVLAASESGTPAVSSGVHLGFLVTTPQPSTMQAHVV
jgi:hypothetical protein